MKSFIIVIPVLMFVFACSINSQAQVNVRDTTIRVSMIYPTYGFSIPGGDMADRFGASHQIGIGYILKGADGWCFSVEGNFIFRDGVKNPGSILSGIATSDGFIIDEAGVFANIMLLQRGFSIMTKVGKLVPVAAPNPNSGLLFQFGAGMLQHKIRIQDPNNSAPQLKGDYKKGYDHLCNGPSISEFVGYQLLSNNRKINFFAGFEFVQAYTFSRRAYYFNEMIKPSEKRIDLLYTIKAGWYMPLYRKTKQKFFYY